MLVLLIGLVILSTGKVHFSSTRGLVGPEARAVGGVFVVASLLPVPPVSLFLIASAIVYAGFSSKPLAS